MNFKETPNLTVTYSLFDSTYHKIHEDSYYSDPLAKKEVSQIELDEFAQECQKIEFLCSMYNIPLLQDPLRLVCKKFKEDFIYSCHCFQNTLISKDSLLYLISMFSSPLLPKNTRWLLVSFFIDASFHNSVFSKDFCQNSHALNYLLDTFANPAKHEGHLDELFKLIYNIVSDCPTFFSPSYVTKLTLNAFKSDSTPSIIYEKFSYFLMNFFRSYTAQVPIEIYHPENIQMIQFLQKWFSISKGYTFEHMLWSFYFWFTNTSDFTSIFYETFFFDVIISQLNINVNETCLKISLSVVAMALSTSNADYKQQIFDSVPIHNIISLIFDDIENISQETKTISLRLLSNYAASGPTFIDNLLENQMHTKILDNFNEMQIPLKIESGHCFAIAILEGNQEQANYFTDEYSIKLLFDCLDTEDENLTSVIFSSLSKLIDLKSDVLNFIDPSIIDEISSNFPSNLGIISNAQKILSFF